tara:strand:+ start:1348 stop:2613 length:1266 start_codon:yes stop_codon:yes gene_type:complete
MDNIKFLHCADLHIDSPFKGISNINPDLKELLYQSTFESFNNIIDLAIQENVHCVIIAGDIYDGADKSLSAQLKFRNGLQRLSDHGIPSFLVYGNHDPLDSWAASIEWPENVFQYGGDKVENYPLTVDGEVIAHIYGISFPTRDVFDNLALQFNRVDENILSIAVLHTNVGENTGHKSYAPATVDELKSRNMDYWALGHVHNFAILHDDNPTIVYPGNSQARNPREKGKKGCCMVTLHNDGACEVVHIPTDVVRYNSSELDLTDVETVEDVIKIMTEKINEISTHMDDRNVVLRLTLSGRCRVNGELNRGNNIEELTDQLREHFEGRTPWIWIEKIEPKTSGVYNVEELKKGNDFFGDIINYYEEIYKNEDDQISEIKELLKPLFDNWQGQKYLKNLSDEEIIEIAKESRNWTLDQMVGDE